MSSSRVLGVLGVFYVREKVLGYNFSTFLVKNAVKILLIVYPLNQFHMFLESAHLFKLLVNPFTISFNVDGCYGNQKQDGQQCCFHFVWKLHR